MTKQLYIICYDSAHWCGGESHCVVWAESPDDAVDVAGVFMEETMHEMFRDEYDDYYNEETCTFDFDDESAVQVQWVELFGSEHDHWEYYQDDCQEEFYPVIGTPE